MSLFCNFLRYIIKAKEVKRKDAAKGGLIIRETMSKTMTELQPREVPFPFTSARDYEIFIQQPLGSEWNSPLAQQGLIQPTIVTKVNFFYCIKIIYRNTYIPSRFFWAEKERNTIKKFHLFKDYLYSIYHSSPFHSLYK